MFRFGNRFHRGDVPGAGPPSKYLTLNQMRAGQSGKVVEARGGPGFVSRLNSLGIRPGRKLTKVNSAFMRGPVTVQVGS